MSYISSYIRHFYHVYASGAWSTPVREHAEALGKSGFEGETVVGLVGYPEDRERAKNHIVMRFGSNGVPIPEVWVEADEGFEQLTLSKLHCDIHNIPGNFPVLYAHTKGAHDDSEWNAIWRRSMTRHVVSNWRACAALLHDYDTVGCHWLTPEEHHNPPDYPVTVPMYGGNYWWARTQYLRELPPPENEYRHQAEEWVGQNKPKAFDLLPGWPSRKLCKQ